MSHKTELRNYLSAAGDDGFGSPGNNSNTPFRAIEQAKWKLEQTEQAARDLFKFLDETCEIDGLDVARTTAATQVKKVTDSLTAAKSAVAALSWTDLDDHWPTAKAAVSDLTDYVEPEESPASPAE
tara:strand:+ start:992 stop:1369 length:378 start_codon:yes stop_codon:yes gene_type:complete